MAAHWRFLWQPNGQHICLQYGHPRSWFPIGLKFNNHVYSRFWGQKNFSYNIFLTPCISLSPPLLVLIPGCKMGVRKVWSVIILYISQALYIVEILFWKFKGWCTATGKTHAEKSNRFWLHGQWTAIVYKIQNICPLLEYVNVKNLVNTWLRCACAFTIYQPLKFLLIFNNIKNKKQKHVVNEAS